MVRNYRPDPVPPESIGRIIEAACKAPSAGFSQGVSFIVITEEQTRRQIADLAGESRYTAEGFDPWISRAPTHIVVAVSERAYHDRYQEADKLQPGGSEIEWPIPYWWVDAGAALMLVLLAAVNEGLAAGFLGVHSIPGLRELLEIPSSVTPIGVVTVGYPLPDRRSGSLARGWKPQEKVVHFERWPTQTGPRTSQPTYPDAVTKSRAELPASRGDV
jgi:nitroreductase